MFVKRALKAAIAALAASAAVSNGAPPPDKTVTCTNVASGVSWQIKIDFEKSTVDSNPAHISSSQISWHNARDGGNYTLDRKSGQLTVIFASSTGGYFIQDRCSLAN